jgi:hypothetical protein
MFMEKLFLNKYGERVRECGHVGQGVGTDTKK